MNFLVITTLFLITPCAFASWGRNDKLPDTTEKTSDGILAFTADLIKTLHHSAKPDENLLFSPVSIYAALALAHLGAAGTTRKEIGALLRSPENNEIDDFHKNVGTILDLIQFRPERVVAEASIANGIFVKKGLELKSSYLNDSSSFYKNEVQSVDFTNGSAALETINQWVDKKTKGRIPQLFKQPLSQDTLMLLASSLYFNGRWSEHFYPSRTKPEKFFTGVEEIEVPLMQNEDAIPYVDHPSLQCESIVLDYDGRDFSFGILLPYPNQTLMNATHHLKAEDIKRIFANPNYVSVDYKLPRIKIDASLSLKSVLKKLGLKKAFDAADFSNMIKGAPVKIGEVKHAAEMEVDEDGTKASAITTMQLIPLSGKVVIHPHIFHCTRPFMAFIYHHQTSTILFASMIHKPN